MPRRTPKRSFSPSQRIFTAEELGIEPFASQAAQAEKRLRARALAAKSVRGPLWDIARRFGRKGIDDRRLLEKVLSLPESERVKGVGILAEFAHVPRARRELLRLAKMASGVAFVHFARTLGHMGGPGVRTLLRNRLRELDRTIEKTPRGNVSEELGYAVSETAWSLLRVDHAAIEAADVLIRMFRDPGRYGESTKAVTYMSEVVIDHGSARSAAMTRIRETLRTLLEPDANEDDFSTALDALLRIDARKTLQRATETLHSRNGSVRAVSAYFLSRWASDPEIALLPYVQSHPDDWSVIGIVARRLGSLVPLPVRYKLVEQQLNDPDPGNRLGAAEYLRTIRTRRAVDIACHFLRAEPDPLIARVLEMCIEGRRGNG